MENPNAKDSILVLAIIDEIPESDHNMRLIFDHLKFPLPDDRNIMAVFDIKLTLIMLGLYASGGIYSCPFGECYREQYNAKQKKKVPTNQGPWVKGIPRSISRCIAWNKKFEDEGRKEKNLRNYRGCRHQPIPLFKRSLWNVDVIRLFSPQPLHLLLGK